MLARALAEILFLTLLWLPSHLAAAEPDGALITILPNGTVSVAGGARIPPYPGPGRWTEGTRRSSERHVVRHFLFIGPGGPPAMELYVTQDLTGDTADGVFEMGLVRGFLSSFGSQVGFVPAPLVVREGVLDGKAIKRCRAALSRAERTIWLYAFIFPRQPALTFLTLRPQPDADAEIESYLTTVRFDER
jgi:hypothetical protein